MPIVHVLVWEGLPEADARKAIEGITKTFTDLGKPAESVRVLIHEVPKSRWGIAGLPASEGSR